MTKDLQTCVDDISESLKSAESDLMTIMQSHMGECTQKQRQKMRKANRELHRVHYELADLRDECFPDVTVQSGGT